MVRNTLVLPHHESAVSLTTDFPRLNGGPPLAIRSLNTDRSVSGGVSNTTNNIVPGPHPGDHAVTGVHQQCQSDFARLGGQLHVGQEGRRVVQEVGL